MKPAKAYLNLLAFRINRRRGVPIINNYPVVAFIDPTSHCNLRCPACPTGAQLNLRPPATLDLELYRSFLNEVGDYLFKLYLYNLGEPLLHKQAPELIALAKERNIFTMVSSNLSLPLSEEYWERLIKCGLDILVVPIDGLSQETYGAYRRQGNLELVKQNMATLANLKLKLNSKTPTITWQFLVFAHNEHEADMVCRLYKAWGADEYLIGGAYMPYGIMAAGFAPSGKAGYNIYAPTHPHRAMLIKAQGQPLPCSWLYGVAVMHPGGSLSPCSYTPAVRDDFGVYKSDEGFGPVWNNERYQAARSRFAEGAFWQAGEGLEEMSRRMDGRGVAVSGALNGDLICSRCPVPFLQDVVDHELTFKDADIIAAVEQSELTPEERDMLEHLKVELQR